GDLWADAGPPAGGNGLRPMPQPSPARPRACPRYSGAPGSDRRSPIALDLIDMGIALVMQRAQQLAARKACRAPHAGGDLPQRRQGKVKAERQPPEENARTRLQWMP